MNLDRFIYWFLGLLGIKTKGMLLLEARGKARTPSDPQPDKAFLLKIAQARDEIDKPILTPELQAVFDYLLNEEFIKYFRSAHSNGNTFFSLEKDDADFYRTTQSGKPLSPLEWRSVAHHLEAHFNRSGIPYDKYGERYEFHVHEILKSVEYIIPDSPNYPDIEINSDQAYR